LIAFLSFIYFVIKNGGFFVLTNDFNDQQIPFTIGLHKSLLDGGISGFSWDVDLGTSTLDAYSFYEMGSPFFWLTMLFPANAAPYILPWLFMLKYAFAGVFSCMYLKRFVNDEKWAVLGSVLYAFSGYSLANMLFYHFHDPIIFFPLMLIGLEIYKEEGRVKPFILSIALNCFINYFFFIGEVMFLILYYLCRFLSKDIKMLLVDVIKCIGRGILGVGMASFMFIPSVLFVSGNPRTGEFPGIVSLLTNDLQNYMYILKTFLLPAEPLTSISAVFEQNFSSHSFYLPMIGLGLVIAYVISHRDFISRIIIACTIAFFVPLFSDAFYLYSAAQMRWLYMFTLMAILASVRALEECKLRDISTGTVVYLIAIIVFAIATYRLNMINDATRFKAIVVTAIAGAIITWIIAVALNREYRLIFAGVSIFSFGLMFTTIHLYRTCAWQDYYQYKVRYDIGAQLELPHEQYRFNDTMNLVSMMAHVAGFTNQTSTDTNSIRDFEAIFDYYHNVSAIPKNGIPGLAELLAGKYYLAIAPDNTTIQEFPSELQPFYLSEREACPIGFAVDSYITMDELMSMDVNNRAIALLDSAVISEKDITEEIKNDLPCNTAADIDLNKSISEYVYEKTIGAVVNFHKDGHGFTCNTTYDKDTYVYFSVPYDTGWTATVDGMKTDIIVSGGMMLVKIPAGNHALQFSYFTPGLKIGLLVSLISWIVFIVMCVYDQKSRKGMN
jgi:uncharacterized membrane protein YfhO